MSIPSASILVKDVVNLLHEKGEKYTRKAASDEINGLVSELSLHQKLVEEIDKEQRIHDWLTEVEKICYDMEDIMVENQSKNTGFLSLETIKRWFFSDVDDDFPGQISMLRKRIRHLLGVGELLSQGKQNNRPPLSSGLRQKKDFVAVGLVNEFDFLLNRILELKSDSFSPNVISVVGIGCLGKTTLVRRLYNHGSLHRHFEAFAWVSLGTLAQRDFDQLWGALGSILMQLVPAANEMLRNYSLLHGMLEFIVKRCKGIPLAITVLGSLLATKQTSGEWKAALRAMELCNVHQEDSLQLLELEILSLCYDNMPHHLKLCFLYLGLFPEQPSIEAETLYQLWIAEGFV
ncbi:disease resistance RPP8-like protein 3 [Coffea eugenioides]|uniref:disease resistance RPP8-like protein 3 n=1 Tax=Coffea eugenioides TaxID=49369 RepID=UPI000F60E369|nr:disease resistance RPP8-like protein 3 [Coffea eugenioides]